MGKKRKSRGKSMPVDRSKATPKLKDPDPNSAELMYDKMEMFHLNKDKILLDPKADREDEEDGLEENFDEEVLALGGESSDEEEEEEEEDDEAEEDEEGDEQDDDDDDDMLQDSDNDDGVNDKAWGKSKKTFYNTDVQDDDIYTSDEEAQLAAEEEEKEAMVLQKRLAEKLDAEDFYAFEDQDDTIEEAEEEKAAKKVRIAKDLSKLSKRERLEILAEESPELLPLLDEYKEKMDELRERYHPLMLLVRSGMITNEDGAKFIETKHQLLLNYLVNISFYLALKSTAGERTKGHPVIDVLVQHQQIFALMKPAEEKLQPEIIHFLDTYKEEIESGALEKRKTNNDTEAGCPPQPKEEIEEEKIKNPKRTKQVETTMDPLEYYNMVKANTKAKKAKKQKLDEDLVEDHHNEGEEETEEGGKRMITYEMSKNKGLIRNRRKELKNPRVKHKMKFKKAVVKRKGVVREVQREMNRYGGETTGITAMLSRSTKIK